MRLIEKGAFFDGSAGAKRLEEGARRGSERKKGRGSSDVGEETGEEEEGRRGGRVTMLGRAKGGRKGGCEQDEGTCGVCHRRS